TRGFLLNNELTDFEVNPVTASGARVANRVEANKRPRSSMAPTLVFTKAADGSRGDLLMVTGSPGGATIIQFVLKTVISALDWGMDAQQATSTVNFGAANSPTTGIGGEHPLIDGANDPLVMGLSAMGHNVVVSSQSSGVSTIIRTPQNGRIVLQGGADPRREGIALGDGQRP
ncbi:MAG TPA: gamma-glutamyltransferase, partial [Rubrivivax sp.]|nr:gamma-glutamyltransferase [Rubrivivax sp.]